MVPLNRKYAAVLIVGVLGLNCRDSSGPGMVGRLAFAPVFESRTAGIVDFDRLRITLVQPPVTMVLDTVVSIPADADSVDLTLSVPLSSPREDLLLYLRLVNAAGDTVFRNEPYPQPVTVTSGGVPAVVQAPIAYVGVGFDAVSVVIASPDTAVLFGDTLQLDAVAFGAQDQAIPGTPVAWRSLDSTRVKVPDAATGKVVGAIQRGPARIVAELLTGPADTVLVAAQPVPSHLVIVSGAGQSGAPGQPLALPLGVEVRAPDNLPVSGVAVRFRALAGGFPVDTTVVSDSLGRASVFAILGLTPGPQVFEATLPSHATVPAASFTQTALNTGPARLAFSVGPSGAAAGSVLAPAIQVAVQDGSGNPVATDTISVTLTLGSNPTGATLSGPTTVTTSAGIATFSGISLDRAATGYTLLATATGLSSATSAAFAITPAAPQQLVVTSSPAAAFAGATFPSAVVVEAQDPFGNRTPAFSGQVTVGIATNPAGGTLGGSTTAVAVNGVATFAALSIDNPSAGYTLVATSSGLADGTSATIDILPPQAGRFWIASSGGNWSNPANWSGGVVPGPADTVFITLGGTYTVTVDVNDTVAFLNVGSGSGVQTLSITSRTFGIDSAAAFGPTAAFNLNSSTLNGASGTLLNQGAVTAQSSIINSAFINSGTATLRGSVNFNADVSTTPGSTFRVEGDAFFSSATVTALNDLVNLGTIELTAINSSGTTAQLNVTNGALLNAAGATIDVLPGTGGTRVIGAELDNQGTLNISQPLTLSKPSAGHQNSGTIDIGGGDLSLTQSGTSPSFTTTGSIVVGAGRTLAVSSGLFDFAAGTLGGTGTAQWSNGTLNLGPDLSNATLTLALTSTTVNGPGSLINASGRTLTLTGGLIMAPLANQGLLIARGFPTINGALTMSAASTLRVEGDAFFSSALTTVSNGFVNNGTIDLVAINGGGTVADLDVTAGTLVNAPGATINALPGNGGGRTIRAQLDNQGTITVSQPLTITETSAAHQNSGTIDVSGADLTLTQSGASASFTISAGAINVAATRTFTVSGGVFNYAGGSLGGAGSVVWNGPTVNLTPDFDNAITGLTLTNALVNGPGRLTNTAGRTLIQTGGQINAPVTNEGLLIVRGSAGLGGALTTSAGSTLRVEGDAFFSSATLTVQDGFTNLGTIELDAINGGGTTSQLNVTNGTLINAPGAVLAALTGAGNARFLNAQLDNQGSIVVNQPLTISKSSAAHLNSGTIDISGANLSLTLAGVGASFSTSGTVTVGSGRSLDVSGGGAFSFAGGSLDGSGSINWSGGTLNLSQPLSNTSLNLTLSNATVNGPGTLTNAPARSLVLTSGVMNAPLDNQGALTIRGGPAINGPFTTATASLLRVEGDAFFSSANATFLNGFTNNGTIELTAINGAGQPSTIAVTNGTLVNAPGGTINVQTGSGSTRNLNASLDNQGILKVEQNLTMARSSSVITNSGTIDLTTGDLLISQSGTSPSVTNIGTVIVGAGRTWTVTGGAWTHDGGTLAGNALALTTVNPALFNKPHTLAGITLNGTTATFSAPQNTDATQFTLTNSIVNGSGTFTNAGGKALVMTGGTLDLAFTNAGLLKLRGTTVVKGVLTTVPGSILQVEGDASFSSAFATIDQGFVNNGTIELSAINGAGTPSQLSVTNGLLTNAVGATILVEPGTGGSRALNAMLDNQGLIKVSQPVTITHFNALHINRGTIDVAAGDLTINQAGGNPGFINSAPGVIGIAAGRTVKISSGNVTNEIGAKIFGSGTLDVSTPATFSSPGELAPGTSPGILTVLGDAQIGNLTIELGGPTEGTEYDQLRVSGDAVLSGTLSVTPITGFGPGTFIILRSATNGGGTRFGTVNGLPPTCSPPVYTPTQVTITCS